MLRLRNLIALAVTGTLTLAAAQPLLFQDMEMPGPTEEHQMLQKRVGNWEGTITMFIPGMPEEPSPAKETVRSAGPFWTISEFESEFMGQPYRGHGCDGFDPESGMYQSTWIDNMSSFLSIMKGEYDAEKGMLISHWNAPDMTGTMAPHRAEHVAREDGYTMNFFANGEKTMVIEMKRKGGRAMEAGKKQH